MLLSMCTSARCAFISSLGKVKAAIKEIFFLRLHTQRNRGFSLPALMFLSSCGRAGNLTSLRSLGQGAVWHDFKGYRAPLHLSCATRSTVCQHAVWSTKRYCLTFCGRGLGLQRKSIWKQNSAQGCAWPDLREEPLQQVTEIHGIPWVYQ